MNFLLSVSLSKLLQKVSAILIHPNWNRCHRARPSRRLSIKISIRSTITKIAISKLNTNFLLKQISWVIGRESEEPRRSNVSITYCQLPFNQAINVIDSDLPFLCLNLFHLLIYIIKLII